MSNIKTKAKELKSKTKKYLKNRRYIVIERDGEVFESKRDVYLRDGKVISINEVVKVIITKKGKNKNMRILSKNGTYTIVYLSEIKYICSQLIGDIIR